MDSKFRISFSYKINLFVQYIEFDDFVFFSISNGDQHKKVDH